MNYIGSKLKLCDFIVPHITNAVQKPLSECMFCDLFAGTGAIGRAFKGKVKSIIANDKEFYSFVLNQHYIGNNATFANLNSLIKKLDNLQGIKGKIYSNYSLGGTQGKAFERLYFSDENAMKIDSIRTQIENLKRDKAIDLGAYYFLLASLLECADKVANVASVYGAFLKHLKKSALKSMEFRGAKCEIGNDANEVHNCDASEIIRRIKGDILYLDPPYNAREYGANYHLLNTIALYDDFAPQGKTGLREYEKSAWCKKGLVADELESLIKRADFEWICLSYNDEGILGLDEIEWIFKSQGTYKRVSTNYQRFKADSNRTAKQQSTIEYLHILRKNG